MKLYGTWKVTLPDEEYLFEPDEILGSEWGAIEAQAGMSFDEWATGIDTGTWVPCQVLVWYLRQKAGRQEERREVDFKIRQLRLERVEDPKVPAPTRRTGRVTSKRSGDVSE